MNRSPDPDPQRGPRRYGPSSSNDPSRPRMPPHQAPSRNVPPGYQAPGTQTPGYQPPPPPRQAWSQQPDRTAVYPPGVLGYDDAPPPRQAPPRSQRPGVAQQQPAAPVGYRPSEDRPHRTPGLFIAGRIIAAVLSVAVLAGFAFAWGFANKATGAVATGNDTAKAGTAGVLFKGGENILLIGSDARTDQQGNPLSAQELAAVSTQDDGGGVNTDTIMIVHIPQGGGKATAVSIPRDTWIPQSVTDIVKGPYNDGTSGPYKPNKVNSFYSTAKFYTQEYEVSKGVKNAAQRERDSNNAGRTELQAIIQAFTGLHIDHYAEVNLIGFYTLSNAIGGVPVCLNAAVNDPFSGANFKAGPQDISGSAAMAFVRQRHGLPNGDLDRVRRQQAFLAGATSKMLSAGILTSPSKLSNLMSAASRSLILDSGFDLLSFAAQMADLSGGNMTFETIPTHGSETSTNTDALATDPAEIKAFFAAINGKAATPTTSGKATTAAGGTVDPASITVDVQNAAKVSNLASSVSSTLVAAGFKAGDVTTYPGITAENAHDTTTIGYPSGAKASAAAVQKALGGKGKLVEDGSVAVGHISVAAGKDMPPPSGLRAPVLSRTGRGRRRPDEHSHHRAGPDHRGQCRLRQLMPVESVTAALLGPLLRGDPHRPRLTTYASGFRTELSTASLANWSAKVAGLLLDELGSSRGDLVYVGLGAGWQTAPILLGAWWAGLTVTDQDLPETVAAFVPDGADPSLGSADEVFVVSGHPLGAPSQSVAAHQRDFTTAVLPQADRFSPRGDAASVAASSPRGDVTVADLLAAARAVALADGARLASTLPWTLPGGIAATLLAALSVDGSLVHSDSTGQTLVDQALAERATVTAGFDTPGLPRLA